MEDVFSFKDSPPKKTSSSPFKSKRKKPGLVNYKEADESDGDFSADEDPAYEPGDADSDDVDSDDADGGADSDVNPGEPSSDVRVVSEPENALYEAMFNAPSDKESQEPKASCSANFLKIGTV